MQALLKFIPKGRKDAKPKMEAAKPAAIAEADDDSEQRQGMEDDTSYVVVELSKPLGIVFQANPPPVSEGACIRSFDEGGAAAVHGRLRVGDQLVGIAGTCVMGQDVDRCINLIVASRGKTVKVTFFRGQAKHLYGKGKPSDAWIQNLLRGVNVGSCRPSPPLDRRSAAGAAKRKMALSAGDEASDEEAEEGFEDDAAGLPASVAECIRGEGLDADLLRARPPRSCRGPCCAPASMATLASGRRWRARTLGAEPRPAAWPRLWVASGDEGPSEVPSCRASARRPTAPRGST